MPLKRRQQKDENNRIAYILWLHTANHLYIVPGRYFQGRVGKNIYGVMLVLVISVLYPLYLDSIIRKSLL